MSFECPSCLNTTLKISGRLEIPPDSAWDEITLQIVKCRSCDLQGIAVYQESRRGSLDDEIIHHTGYHIPLDELKELKTNLKKCPDPGNTRCNCTIHQKYNQRTTGGRWSPPITMDWKTSFHIKYIK